MYVQRLGGFEQPVPVAAVPLGTVTSYSYMCAGNNMIIDHNGTESVFHIDTRTWEITPSGFDAVGGGGVSPISGRLAVASDRETVFLEGARRSGAGMWEPTGVDGHVFATDAEILVIGDDRAATKVSPE